LSKDKEIIELLIVVYSPIDDENVSESELKHISVFFPEILAEMLRQIEQDKEE